MFKKIQRFNPGALSFLGDLDPVTVRTTLPNAVGTFKLLFRLYCTGIMGM